MITYPKALRSVLVHLVNIMPAERNPTGRCSTGKRMNTAPLSARLPVNVLERLQQESDYRTETTGKKWSNTQCLEQALLWYFELSEHGREI